MKKFLVNGLGLLLFFLVVGVVAFGIYSWTQREGPKKPEMEFTALGSDGVGKREAIVSSGSSATLKWEVQHVAKDGMPCTLSFDGSTPQPQKWKGEVKTQKIAAETKFALMCSSAAGSSQEIVTVKVATPPAKPADVAQAPPSTAPQQPVPQPAAPVEKPKSPVVVSVAKPKLLPLMPFSRVSASSKEEVVNRLITGEHLLISEEKLIERLKEIIGRKKGLGTGDADFTTAHLLEILRLESIVVCTPFKKSEVKVDALVRAKKEQGVDEIASIQRDSYPSECYLGVRVGERVYRVMSLSCFNTIEDHTGIPVERPTEAPRATPPPEKKTEWVPYVPPSRPSKTMVVVVVNQQAPPPQVAYIQQQPQVMYPQLVSSVPSCGFFGCNNSLMIVGGNRRELNITNPGVAPPVVTGGPPVVGPPVFRPGVGGPPIVNMGGGALPGAGPPILR